MLKTELVTTTVTTHRETSLIGLDPIYLQSKVATNINIDVPQIMETTAT
jgi:hypothetical protein